MRVIWLGHSSFMIVSTHGTRIVIDPYSDVRVNYKYPRVQADVVLQTHFHPDHSAVWQVGGNPVVVKHTTDHIGEYEINVARTKERLVFQAFPTHHDAMGGRKYGPNTVFAFIVDGIKLCHCGDLGHVLPDSTASDIGSCDILFCPIGGGGYTLDKQMMLKVMDQLKAIVVFPMHFKTSFTPWIADPIDGLEKMFPSVQKADSFHFTFIGLPHLPQIIMLSEQVWRSIPEEIDPDKL